MHFSCQFTTKHSQPLYPTSYLSPKRSLFYHIKKSRQQICENKTRFEVQPLITSD